MNSKLTVISTLININIEEKCLINFLMNVSTKALNDYLECASIYKGTSSKKKTDLIEMIVYGCMSVDTKQKRFKRHNNKKSKINTK